MNSSSSVAPVAEAKPPVKTSRQQIGLMISLACLSFINTFNSGTLTASLPAIASDLDIPENRLLWPVSVYSLSLGATMLPLGAVADVIGNRPVFLIGSLQYVAWTLGLALSQTSTQLIVFRTLQGFGMAFCMPTAVSIITNSFPKGRPRNIAFAAFGGGSPTGFAAGLVLGGALAKVAGWRASYYLGTSAAIVTLVLASFTLPHLTFVDEVEWALILKFDWVGIASASASLTLWSYSFAILTDGASAIQRPGNIVAIILAALTFLFFILWCRRLERLGRVPIIPISVWRSRQFTAVCITVFLVWAFFNAFGYWATLFFQETQQLNSLQAAIRFLPLVVVSLITNFVAGITVDKIPAPLLMLIGGVASVVAPLLYAVQSPDWSYWASAFLGMCLCGISCDLLFCMGNLIITNQFPSSDQALAGSVFNTVSQLGNSMGPAVTAVIAAAVKNSKLAESNMTDQEATLSGYRAAFWACFATAVVSTIIGFFGLRKAGIVGRDDNQRSQDIENA